MDRRYVRIEGERPELLRELVRLELLIGAHEARRRAAVHLLALWGAPLLLAAVSPALVGGWRAFVVECWLMLATLAGALWAVELHTKRKRERTFQRSGPAP